MVATLEDRSPAFLASSSWAALLLETLALTAVMAAPFFVLGHVWGVVGVGLVALGYVIWGAHLETLDGRAFDKPPPRVLLLVLVIMFAGGIIPTTLAGSGALAWLLLAYSLDVSQALAGISALYLFLIPVALLAPPVLFLAVIAQRPAREGGATTELRTAIREKGFAPFAKTWTSHNALGSAIICLMVFAASVLATQPLLEALYYQETPSVWDHAATFPFVPVALVGGAAMLVIFRRLESSGVSVPRVVQTYAGRTGDSPAAVSRGQLAAVACAMVTTFYVIVHPIHFGLVAALSSVEGLAPAISTEEAIGEWVEEQRAAGRTGAEMAAILNAHGSWSADASEAGLPALFPGLKDSLPEKSVPGLESCSIALAAGVANPAALSGVDWLEAEQAGSDLRYCIRTSCPSPVVWDAPDPVMLISSHSSRNQQWLEAYFIDIFANGRALEPGGYCTADGELADEFQG